MYLRRAREVDRKMVDSWKGLADGMLVVVSLHAPSHSSRITVGSQTGLFSAAVAALLAMTVQDIRPNSQDTSAFYLARIHQQLSKQLNEPQIPSQRACPITPLNHSPRLLYIGRLG